MAVSIAIMRPDAARVGGPNAVAARPLTGRVSGAQIAAAVIVSTLLVLATALFDPDGFRPFSVVRWPLVGAGVLVALALVWRDRPALPRWLSGFGLAFLAWMVVATVLAVDPATAWWGHPQRHFGLVAWFVCVAAFRLGTALRPDVARRVVGVGAIVGSAVLGVGALLDVVGLHPAGIDFPGSRVGGLTGLPSYLGAAGVLLVPLAAGAAAELSGVWRRLGYVAALLGVAGVVASQTRGAWIGLLVALVVAWPVLGPRRIGGHVILAAGGLLFVAVAVLTPVGGRVVSVFDLTDGTTRGRVSEWQLAAQVAAEHPVVGVGPEGYRVVVPAKIDADYAADYGREVVVDRAHDGVLDLAVTGGLPAVGLLLVPTVGVAAMLWRRRRTMPPWVAGATAAVLGYAAQQIVLFPIAELEPLVWVVAGVAFAAVSTTSAPAAHGPTVGRLVGRRVTDPWCRVALVGVAGVLLVFGGLGIAADRQLAAASRLRLEGDHLGALAAADAATRLEPRSIDTWYAAAEIAASGPAITDVDDALDRIESGLRVSPRDPALLDLQLRLLAERAARSGLTDDRAVAVDAIEARTADDPTNAAAEAARAQLGLGVGHDDATPEHADG